MILIIHSATFLLLQKINYKQSVTYLALLFKDFFPVLNTFC